MMEMLQIVLGHLIAQNIVNQEPIPRPVANLRIVGGEETDIEDAPWMASLHANGLLRCGAFILSSSRVATSAHCVKDFAAHEYSVRLGSSRSTENGLLLGVVHKLPHPEFNTPPRNNDIAILTLSSCVVLNGINLDAVNLPRAGFSLREGDLVSVYGYGLIVESKVATNHLRTVDVRIVSNEECNRSYRNQITDAMMCAGYAQGQRDACQGDSGGPLMAGNTLVGIVSFGEGCARPFRYGVYAKVSCFISWIKENI